MIYEPVTSYRGLCTSAVFFSRASCFPRNYRSILRSPNATSYIRFTRIRVMVCSSIRIIFETRAAGVTRYYEDWSPHCTSFWVSIALGSTTLLPYFPMLQFGGNESNTAIHSTWCESPVSREWSSKFALVFTTYVVQRRGWNCRWLLAPGIKSRVAEEKISGDQIKYRSKGVATSKHDFCNIMEKYKQLTSAEREANVTRWPQLLRYPDIVWPSRSLFESRFRRIACTFHRNPPRDKSWSGQDLIRVKNRNKVVACGSLNELEITKLIRQRRRYDIRAEEKLSGKWDERRRRG